MKLDIKLLLLHEVFIIKIPDPRITPILKEEEFPDASNSDPIYIVHFAFYDTCL